MRNSSELPGLFYGCFRVVKCCFRALAWSRTQIQTHRSRHKADVPNAMTSRFHGPVCTQMTHLSSRMTLVIISRMTLVIPSMTRAKAVVIGQNHR